jgi:hypothetical protein
VRKNGNAREFGVHWHFSEHIPAIAKSSTERRMGLAKLNAACDLKGKELAVLAVAP